MISKVFTAKHFQYKIKSNGKNEGNFKIILEAILSR